MGGRDRLRRLPRVESVHPPDQRRAPRGREARGPNRAAGRAGTTFKPTVRAVERNRELRWLGRLLLPGIFDGEHSLLIERQEGGRSRFVMSERFTGILVGLFKGTLAKTEAGFEQMNVALKARVEQSSAQN